MDLLRHMIVICLCSCLCLVGCGADSDGSDLSVEETTQYTEDNASEPTEANQEMATDVTEENEQQFILAYRKADKDIQNAVNRLLDVEEEDDA